MRKRLVELFMFDGSVDFDKIQEEVKTGKVTNKDALVTKIFYLIEQKINSLVVNFFCTD